MKKIDKLKQISREIFSKLFSNKFTLSLSSFSFFILFYLVYNKVSLFDLKSYFNYIIYLGIGLCFSIICLFATKIKNGTDKQEKINSIKPLEFSYIPIYLGLFIISLSLNSFATNKLETIFIISLIYIIWIKLESTSFFNLFWLFIGYRFYEITTDKSIYTFISKKKDIKDRNSLNNLKMKRINNYTFFEVESK